MSIEDQASSWALSLFDLLDSPSHTRKRIIATVGAALVTAGMWIMHLLDPDIVGYFLDSDNASKLVLGVLLAPPFVAAFGVATFIYPQAIERETRSDSGLMSTYFYQERSSRRWKLLIAAGIVAAVNLLVMLVTAVA